MDRDTTGQHQDTRFQPGQSGNPAGRPKGSRNKLGEAFLSAMHADFEQHGKDVIETVRREKPDQYLKVVASILPKEFHVTDETLDGMSDADLIDFLAAVRSAKAERSGRATRAGVGEAAGEDEARNKPH